MYPRNASSPPRIAVGPVVQSSDGAVQTSGVSVVVRPEGGAETAGAGTIEYGASSGIVYYTPTQGETNYTAFVVVAYKAGCLPASQTIVTTEATTAGQVVTDAASRTASKADLSEIAATLGTPAGESLAADIASITPSDATLAKQDAILAAIAALDVGTGSGPNEITLTFEDQDETAVNGLAVGVYDSGVLTAVGTTGGNGQLTVYINNGTYSVRAAKTGYQMAAQTLTAPVTGDAPTYTVTRLTPTPSTEPDTVTGRYLCHVSRVAAAGLVVYLRPYALPTGDAGNAFDYHTETQTSDADGLAYFANLVVGAKYRIRVGDDGAWTVITVPSDDDADGIVDLPSVLEAE